MCLAIIARQVHAQWPLVIAANRDEFHARPTRAAGIWEDAPQVLAGRDLMAGGTWLGLSQVGRIALLTNFREPGKQNPAAPSRGALVSDYLCGPLQAQAYAASLAQRACDFNGFNLLLIDPDQALYLTNRRTPATEALVAGVQGVSNATLGVPWPKLVRTQQAVGLHLARAREPNTETLFAIFRDTQPALDAQLPDTGLEHARERLLSSPFILSPDYGTRCTTLVMQHVSGDTFFYERRFDAKGEISGTSGWKVDTIRHTITPLTCL